MMGDPLNSQAPMQVQRSPLVVKSPAMNAKMTAQQSSAQFAANQQVNMVDTSVSMMQPTSSTSQADLFGSNGPLVSINRINIIKILSKMFVLVLYF